MKPTEPIRIARRLGRAVEALSFAPPVTHVYHPLRYARRPAERYLERWARPGVEAMFLGMNPGPFGMAQTGVPFGEVVLARDFLGVEARVDRPPDEHPKRPVLGFECPRREVSGLRVWSWVQERFGSAEAFFTRFFVWNYCPAVFLEESGRNRTPDKLTAAERDALYAPCDRALREMVACLGPRIVIGVGGFAAKRAATVFADEVASGALEIGTVLHPSPASPMANRGWAEQAEKQLEGILGE